LLQLWLRLAVMTFLMLCMVLLWLISPGWCPSQQFSWLGLMPMQVSHTGHCLLGVLLANGLCIGAAWHPCKMLSTAAAWKVWISLENLP